MGLHGQTFELADAEWVWLGDESDQRECFPYFPSQRDKWVNWVDWIPWWKASASDSFSRVNSLIEFCYFSDSFGDFAVSVLSAWIGVRIPWWLISLINFLRINLNFFTAASLHCVLCTSLAIFYDYDAIISLAARSFSLSGKKIHFVRFHRALNYGSIGSILAHELTHGEIDDEVQLPQWMGDYSQWM